MRDVSDRREVTSMKEEKRCQGREEMSKKRWQRCDVSERREEISPKEEKIYQ